VTGAIGGPFDLGYHRGRSYLQPNGDIRVQAIPAGTSVATRYRLYDVWINDTTIGTGATRTGFGITFWSTRDLTATTAGGSASNIPLAGITAAQFNGTWAWLADARTNVIGYWDVEFGWKRYYGIYEVPQGQARTEFAFRSRRVDGQNGNFLDNVSFNAPAFLSVDKFIRLGHGAAPEASAVAFVKPGDSLTVDLRVRNWGDISADTIVIRDRITPFNQYINVGTSPITDMTGTLPPGMVSVTRGDGTPVPGIITATHINGIITITLPAGESLAADQELRITFPITVRNNVLSNLITPTLLYFFKNQAVVEYRENFLRYGTVRNLNGSGPDPVEVFINPVSLLKTVESVNPPSSGSDSLINGPFRINMSVINTMPGPIDTDGLINDVIPPGFRLTSNISRTLNGVTAAVSPSDVSIESEPDGSTRLTLSNVNLSDSVRRIDYSYTIEYIGPGYGVSTVHLDSAYRFMYSDNETVEPLSVLLRFPHCVVGIRARTEDDFYSIDELITYVLDITANDSFTPVRPDVNSANIMADENYDVSPTVVLTDAYGTPLEANIIDNSDFTAVLVPGTYNIELTPKAGASGVFTIYYQTQLIATRPGGMSFNLSSRITPVTITIGGEGGLLPLDLILNDELGDGEFDDSEFEGNDINSEELFDEDIGSVDIDIVDFNDGDNIDSAELDDEEPDSGDSNDISDEVGWQ